MKNNKNISYGALFAALAVIFVTGTLFESAAQSRSFAKSLKLHGITFSVSSPNRAKSNTVTVRTRGLTVKNDVFTEKAAGIVTGAEVADLNADGSPELFVYVSSPADKKGSVIAFSANDKKSLSYISLPELTSDQKNGYRGGDEFTVIENSFARRFPIYGSDGKATGKFRQFQYKLKAGEASWQLVVENVTEF